MPNQAVHRTGARRSSFGVAELSSLGFAANARFQAPVGDFHRWAKKMSADAFALPAKSRLTASQFGSCGRRMRGMLQR
jgi:hypothetical protein